MDEPKKSISEPLDTTTPLDPSISTPPTPKPRLIADNPMSKATTPSEFWPKNPRARERSLSRAVSIIPYNPAAHYMDTEWIARRATFLHHLDENEKTLDAELVADMKRWNQEIVDSEWALNDLASPKQYSACSRGNVPEQWLYEGQLHTTEQDLRRKWPPLPFHRYRHFKHDSELVRPEDWEETHQRSHLVGDRIHPLAELYHDRSHDKEKPTEEEQIFIDRLKKIIENQRYVANVPRFIFGHYPATNEQETYLPFELQPEKTIKKLNIWPKKPKIYPNYLEPPPGWRTCEKNAITHYLPSSKMEGQELCDAWARFNKHEKKKIMWNPSFLRTNNKYFPVVLHVNPGSNWIGGYNREPQNKECPWPWLCIAMMNFLPPDVNTVIAGEKGLVVVDGGDYLTLPNQEFWRVKWPSQSITMVINPLVQTFQIVPPLEDPKYAQEFKIAKLLVEEHVGRSKSYYKLYMVGERTGSFVEGGVTCTYSGSLVTIYDSRSHTISDINTFEVRPSPLGVSSLVVMHGHMIWGGIHVMGQRERITEVKSRRYQPAMGALEFKNGVVSYDILHKRFRFQKFALNPKVGDLGDEDKWEAPRILCAYGIACLVTRQLRSSREFKMRTCSDSTFYVLPPQVFRIYNNADPVHVHPMSIMPIVVYNWLFGAKQEDYNKCRFDVRGGMGDLCIFAYLTMNFAICTPEIDRWRILDTTLNILPSLPSLLRLADCEFTPNFRAEPKHQPGEHYLAWEGRTESYPKLFRPPAETLLPNEDHRVRCCDDDPLLYREGSNIMGPHPLVLKKQLALTSRELHYKAMLDVADGHRQSLRRRTIVPLARNSMAAATHKSFRKLSYVPPTVPPNWFEEDRQEKKGPPHPPTRPIEEFND